ncbi:transglutaminase-like cysteine peptidase [Pseudomonas sp. 2FE]|uniref:transglutaminase-like cysteine peptidase n=1 Tax=Pseudomonas sp. 2FE TaxID=2502190 RepID=UPI0010FA3C26|nr:transglutaminase-like cysteine peptidase [Pseudomonas sp. 2FE]
MAEAKASWSFDLILRKAEKRYGRLSPATDRLLSWGDLIESSRHLPEMEKLKAVNRYFNRHVRFSGDIALWKQDDYWATPIETLVKGAGDCEDFSLAKYFTLRQLGVPEEKLRIVYAKVLKLNQAHMVMTYYSTPTAEPLVLDNLIYSILPASERQDLSLLYAFDAKGLYFVREEGLERFGDTEHLPYWQALLKKMRQEGFTAKHG